MSQLTLGAPPSTPINTESHLSVLELLPEYVMLLVLGQRPHPAWRPVEHHLARCPACHAESDSLLQHMTETYTGALPPAPAPPPAALPFLKRRHARPEPPPPARAAGGQPDPHIYHAQISAALLAQMQVRIAARGGELRLRYAYTFPTLRPGDPAITMEVLSADEDTAVGIARVCVELADRSPFDQAGSRVTLASGVNTLTAVTDQGGVVIFSNVHLATIADWQISVEPGEV